MSDTPKWILERAAIIAPHILRVLDRETDDEERVKVMEKWVAAIFQSSLIDAPVPVRSYEGETRWICLEGMNSDELAAYDYGSSSCLHAVKQVLDGHDVGVGKAQPEWQSVRQRLIDLVSRMKSISETSIKASPEGQYAVSADISWRYDPAPRGVKIYLLTKGGVAIAPGEWRDGMGLIGWNPIFKRDKAKEVELGLTDDYNPEHHPV